MAKKKRNPPGDRTSIETRSFNKGMIKDTNDSLMPEGSYFNAINAVNNSREGDLGVIGNEASNLYCTSAPYTIIGSIHLFEDKWVIFSTTEIDSGNPQSEIGLFDESECRYNRIVNDPCLSFSQEFLIIGESKENYDCTWQIYWADGLNPDRTLNIGDIVNDILVQPWPGVPYICEDVPVGGGESPCIVCEPIYPLELDCEKTRLARLTQMPCTYVSQGPNGGELLNGSYQVCIAYTKNEQRVTDYSLPSNVQALFDHRDVNGSLDIEITNIDETYDEFELVLIRVVNQQTVAKRMGTYSTSYGTINIDRFNENLETIPLEFLPLIRPSYEKSEGIYRNGEYLLRVAPTTRFDFNYQIRANNIKVKWVSVELPPDYYEKGGNITSYLRDEQYSFFIRWIYNTADKSSSYHIPGRAAYNAEVVPVNGDLNAIEIDQGYTPQFWEVYNTAFMNAVPLPSPLTPEYETREGTVIAEGDMGYWESTEKYPDNMPDVWGNLCGKNIRHHKMPDYCVYPQGGSMAPMPEAAHFKSEVNAGDTTPIRVIGVRFENIQAPVDNDGNPIPGIVGYEILRGSREGNKTIVAKGIINNMRQYKLADKVAKDNITGLFQNYPYNDLHEDMFFSREKMPGRDNPTKRPYPDINDLGLSEWNFRKDTFTFHAADTNFRHPFLGADELKINMLLHGDVEGNYDLVKDHPSHKVLSNFSFIVAAIVGLGTAFLALTGKRNVTRSPNKVKYPEAQGWPTWRIVEVSSPVAGGLTGGNTPVDVGGGVKTNFWSGVGVPGLAAISGTSTANSAAGVAQAGATTTINNISGSLNAMFGTGNDVLIGGALEGVDSAITGAYAIPVTGGAPHTWNLKKLGDWAIEYEQNSGGFSGVQKLIFNIPMLSYYWCEGTEASLRLIKNLVPFKNYALAARSHCFYNRIHDTPGETSKCGTRRLINAANYLDNHVQDFNTDKLDPATGISTFKRYRINNLFRGDAVVLQVTNDIQPYHEYDDDDKSRLRIADLGSNYYNYDEEAGDDGDDITLTSPWSNAFENGPYSAAFYTSMKNRIRNQYGQLDSIIQVPASNCVFDFKYDNTLANQGDTVVESGVVFGGDTYIGRYTEKNTMFYFYDWMFNQPDGFEFNYRLRYMLPYSTYWFDSKDFDTDTFISGLFNMDFSNIVPSNFHNFDRGSNSNPGLYDTGDGTEPDASSESWANSFFWIKDAYFYLFNSGVRDFYIESEINIDLRDWDNVPEKRYYDPQKLTDLPTLFATDIIKAGNYYKYDYSLSVSRLYQEFASWGSLQYRDYDPEKAEKCFTYWPNRMIYSLPQHKELRYDNWTSYLVNNYRDFTSKVTEVRQVGLGGAYILFDAQAPAQIVAEDSWKYDQKQKLTIGDGGLFAQPLQHIVNADPSFEFGSCQDRLSVTNTPAGMFYMSQNQGKIFHFANKLDEISAEGMKWWFEQYMPYKLLEDFPDFDITSNPVAGIGCQSIYDNSNGIMYFCKKDYKLHPRVVPGSVEWLDGIKFRVIDSGYKFLLGDPTYFLDASWTVSYDAKLGYWVSFHDWHPDLSLPGRNIFMTTKDEGIWKHNVRCDSFGEYYGTQHGWEIEMDIPYGQTVNTVKSFQYLLECYIWDNECMDKFHDLDYNFDEVVVYNTEQVSGLLKLNLAPKNDAPALLNFPQVNLATQDIDILYNKVEQRYRLNQFWDITRDRGEFINQFGAFSQQPIWDTEYNGYIRNLNQNNLDYAKAPHQRKKFRHYMNKVKFRRKNQTNREMWFKIFNQKDQFSPR